MEQAVDVDIQIENLQAGDIGSSHVKTDCLRLPEILRKIMEYFSTTELLQLSLVNKQWDYEARSLIKSRGNLIAKVDDGDTCKVLGAFAHNLQQTKEMRQIVPFSGMSIALGDWNGRGWCLNSSRREEVQLYDVLNEVNWKHLSFRLYSGWEQHIACPSFHLVKRILRLDLSVLEELSLSLQSVHRINIKEVLQKGRFPRLKTLRFLDSDHKSTLEDYTRIIKALVSTAPNLQVLYTEDRVDLSANLLEGSSAIHVTNYPNYALLREIPENVIGQLRVQRLQLTSRMEDCNLERFNRMTPALLESSRTTLTWMSVDIMFLIPLTCYGICLESVKDLEIILHYGWLCHFKPRVLRLVKSFNFTHIFPNLSNISITSTFNDVHRFLTIANALNDMVGEGNPSFRIVPGRAINIKKLSLKHLDTALYCCAPFLTEMFPNIQTLSIETSIFPFASMRDAWDNLKELEVILSSSHFGNMELDRLICGISSEEVAQLREKDEEYLKSVNIVPVQPSIVCFKGLRAFKLICKKGRLFPNDDPKNSLSKVSGLVAFQRCSDLTVTVATNDKEFEQALSSMKRYLSVVPF